VTSIEDLLNCNPKSLFNDLVKQELIYPLLKTLLKPVNCELTIDDIKRMPVDHIKDIYDGFFFYYPKVKSGLVNTFAGIGSFLVQNQETEKKREHSLLRKLFFSSRAGIS